MKKANKVFCLVLSIALIIAVLSGCIYEKIEVNINADGGGTIKGIVGYSEAAIDMMEDPEAYKAELEKRVIDGKTYYVTEETSEFDSIDEFNESMEDATDMTGSVSYNIRLDRDGSDGFIMTVTVFKGESDTTGLIDESALDYSDMGDMDLGMEDMVVEFAFTFPTEMKQTSGEVTDFIKVSGKTVTVDFMKITTSSKKDLVYKFQSVNASSSEPQLKGFKDVPQRYWAYGTIMKAAQMGLLKGTTEPDANGMATFEPELQISRAEFITVIDRALELEPASDAAPVGAKAAWYDGYVRAAISAGIIKASDFSAYNVSMTRQEMAYVLSNAVSYKNIKVENKVDSSKIPDFSAVNGSYRGSVIDAYSLGLLVGIDEKGTFSPSDVLTRAQAATVLVRLTDLF